MRKYGGLWLVVCGLWLGGAVLLRFAGSAWRHAVMPETEAVFTSTRYVTCLAVAPSGELWAGTLGGLLRRAPDGRWRKFTRADGLPSHEVRGLKIAGQEVTASFPTGAARFSGERWQAVKEETRSDAPPALLNATAEATWRGSRYVASAAGLYVQEGAALRQIPLPPSTGTHISALLPRREALLAALFGDGVWAYDGRQWKPADLNLPPEAREITALADTGDGLWIGTRRAGLWEERGKSWVQRLQPDEPVDHNCQALAMFRGNLFVSTLEDGLAVRTARGWGHFHAPAISSNAPRQMVVFRDALYLRHGSGKLNRWDGARWETNLGADLPRRQVAALAADNDRLYAAQWGGWSEFDGRQWTHHLDLPELQGLPITALCPSGGSLWIGTQNRGLAEYDRRTGRLTWHDERSGLPDDWITALAPQGRTIAAGAFVGGLALRAPGSSAAPLEGKSVAVTSAGFVSAQPALPWKAMPELAGENVTALEPDGAGGLLIATRSGVWRKRAAGPVCRIQPASRFLDTEAQCLCRVPGGLWIGMRTGLFFCPNY